MSNINSCIICLDVCEEYNKDSNCNCKIYVHYVCLSSWRFENNSCMICKTPYKPLPINIEMYRICKSENIYYICNTSCFTWTIWVIFMYFMLIFSIDVFFCGILFPYDNDIF